MRSPSSKRNYFRINLFDYIMAAALTKSFSPKCGAYLRALLNRVNTVIGNIIR